jgi:hypothetical protein
VSRVGAHLPGMTDHSIWTASGGLCSASRTSPCSPLLVAGCGRCHVAVFRRALTRCRAVEKRKNGSGAQQLQIEMRSHRVTSRFDM